MRLIDADALKEKIIDLLEIEWGYEGIRENVSRIIDSMPTTEERPHGEWEWVTDDKYRCTNCGEIIQVKEVMNVPQYIACPMCEARMKEGDEK